MTSNPKGTASTTDGVRWLDPAGLVWGLTRLACRADDRGRGVPAERERELMNTSLTTGNLSYGPVGQNKGAVLTAGNYLRVNDYMYATAPGKYAYFAVLQGNGDLRFYYSTLNDFHACDRNQPYYSLVRDAPGAHIDRSWHFNPTQTNGDYFAIMQTDGNFVIYRGTGPSDNHGPCWATNTWQQGPGPSYAAVLTSTGNLQVGSVQPSTVPTSEYPGLNVTWQSGLDYPSQRVRSGNCLQAGQWMTQNSQLYSANLAYAAGLSQTGAITLSCTQPPGRPLVNQAGQSLSQARQYWTNNLAKPAGPCFTIMQADGNLVTYKGTDPAHNLGLYWALSTTARPTGSYIATITNDGTLAVYAGTDPNSTTPLWTNAAPANPHNYKLSIVSGNNQTIHKNATVQVNGWCQVTPIAVQLSRANGVPCAKDTVSYFVHATSDETGLSFASSPSNPTVTEQDFPTDDWGVATTNAFWVVPDNSGNVYGIWAAAPGWQDISRTGSEDFPHVQLFIYAYEP